MKRKLTIEKFRISQFKNLLKITGGTGNDENANQNAQGTENTTFTTDPNKPCPIETTNHTNENKTVPTFGDANPKP